MAQLAVRSDDKRANIKRPAELRLGCQLLSESSTGAFKT